MFYIIYKITNKINDKVYIGKHITSNLDDGYMGSGKLLKKSILKYGIENFHKEILFQFDNELEMNIKESELVTEEFCLRSDNYNLCVGGSGGFSYINRENKSVNTFENTAIAKAASKIANEKRIWLLQNDKEFREKYIKNISNSLKGKPGTFTGKTHSFETKQKISESMKKIEPEKNSQYGTIWITNGTISKKIKKESLIPEGWYRGRCKVK